MPGAKATRTTVATARPLDYREQSRQPWTSLVFIAPMLVLYEIGVLALGSVASRNGADVWLRSLLDVIGFGQYFLLPVLVCGILLCWHFLTRQPWTTRGKVLGLMLVESLAFGVLLLVLAHLQGSIFGKLSASLPTEIVAATGDGGGQFARIIGYLGAGIYEELLFRLILLPIVIFILRGFGACHRTSIVAAIVIVSLIFSAAHYKLDFMVGPWHIVTRYGDAWSLFSFTFRFLAGVYFAVLFQLRGFGIAAGSHALYDIAVAVM